VTYRDGQRIRYLGWQRNGLPDRNLHLNGCDQTGETAVLPALEIRAVTAWGVPALVGF
jgi:hypothetical protein